MMPRWISQFLLIVFTGMALRAAAQVYHVPTVNSQVQDAAVQAARDDAVLIQSVSSFTIPDYGRDLNSPHGHYLNIISKSVLSPKTAVADLWSVQGAPMDDLPQIDPITKTFSRPVRLNSIRIGAPLAVADFYPVKIGRKWGFADEYGKIVIQPLFSDFEGRNLLLDPNVASLDYFKNGSQVIVLNGNRMTLFIHPRRSAKNIALHPVLVYGKWGYVDDYGHFLIKPKFNRAGVFQGNLAAVLLHHRLYYIHSNGKTAFGGYWLAGTDMERSSFINTRRLDANIKTDEPVEGAPIEK